MSGSNNNPTNIANGTMQTIEYKEHGDYLQGKAGNGPFYTDTNVQGVTQLNFGYGYNLTAQGADGVATLQAYGLPTSVISGLTQYGNTGTTPDTLQALNRDASGESWQGVAQSITQISFDSLQSQLRGEPGIDATTLPEGVQLALTDIAYNGGLASSTQLIPHASSDDRPVLWAGTEPPGYREDMNLDE
jgi:hypothetical protein